MVQITDGQKMVTMSENDSIPSLENLVNDKAAWLYFCPWYMNYLTSEQNNPVDNLIEIYQSDYCITLDELPDLKKYPISGGGETVVSVTTTAKPVVTTTTTTTAKPVSSTTTTTVNTTAPKPTSTTSSAVTTTTVKPTDGKYKKGDANCDGSVDMSDVVLVMQSLANPNKFGTSGSDAKHITVQGAENADVDTTSKGLTSNDALEIQKYLLGLSKWDK
jgi:mannan endo-1,4-beta-mannosidase